MERAKKYKPKNEIYFIDTVWLEEKNYEYK